MTYPPPTILENGSGLASSGCLPAAGSVFPVGQTRVVCTARDRAGNSGSATFSVTVNPAPDGRMFGVGFIRQRSTHWHFVFRAGQRRHHDYGALELWANDPRRCGRDDTFDREPDFDGDHDRDYGREHHSPANRFEATSVDVVFSDDPRFQPGRGQRPTIDTVWLSGTGKWNGRSGYTFEATATDQGEPGRYKDAVSFVIKSPRGDVVASVNGRLDGGNIQSTRLAK